MKVTVPMAVREGTVTFTRGGKSPGAAVLKVTVPMAVREGTVTFIRGGERLDAIARESNCP